MTERENAIALYSFLKEFAQLRTKITRDISQYEREGQVLWASEIPREGGCYCIAWDRDPSSTPEEVWVEIRKPCPSQPPEPPELVNAWVRRDQLGDSSLDFPGLYETLPGEADDDPLRRLEDCPDVKDAWDAYVENQWWQWADHHRREQQVEKAYTSVFSMFQRQQRLGENFEVVFGLGFLNWKTPDGHAVRRHLVSARVSVVFDSTSGTLTVVPAGEGARPSLEQDMLDPQYRPDPQVLNSMQGALKGLGDSLWDIGPLDDLLNSWVNSVAAIGEYSAVLSPPEHADQEPNVHLAPALILRQRSERSYIRAFEDIITQLEAGEPVPEGVSRFISVSDDQRSTGFPNGSVNGENPIETFFPLPANEAQRQIVERLTTNQGVLVQGPPGTGKSHTIVNLICHALATGQRILVTSHAVRALKVLRNMIVERAPDLAPLSVVLLGDDREALLAMEESVQGITTRQNTWDPRASEREIKRLKDDLDQARRRQAEVFNDLRSMRERETLKHDAKFGYSGTLARIAESLRGERDQLSWLPDAAAEDTEPPLTSSELAELLQLLRNERITEWEITGCKSVDTDALPTAEEFDQAVQAEGVARGDYEQDESIRQRPEYGALQDLHEQERQDFVTALGEVTQLIERIQRRPLDWTRTATQQVLGDLERAWRLLYEDTNRVVESTAQFVEWLDRNPVSPQTGTDLHRLEWDARNLLSHLKSGGGWGFGPFRSSVVKRALYVRNLRIGGRLCETTDALTDLVTRLQADIEFMRIRERWTPYHAITAVTFADQVAELRDLCEPLEEAFAALAIVQRLSVVLRRASASFEPDWSDPNTLHHLGEALAAFESTRRYEVARSRTDGTLEDLQTQSLRGQIDASAVDLRAAVIERDPSKYRDARRRALENREVEAQLSRKLALLRRLQDVAPELAQVLIQTFGDPIWDERAPNFERTWNWSRAHGWVVRLSAPGSEEQLRMELENTRVRIAGALEQLAAEKAWTHCFNRMTEQERQSLVAWSKAVRAIGRGTGKYAPIHRANARKHMNESRSAIPAWVMPLHRVAETIRPGSELFDIAIIDEASQSGPEALLLAYLAKKLVVVGDDKQIQPTYAGVNFADVNQLRERYISALPHADAYGVNQSFFDLAEIRYSGRIRLREHFRCMPEIIQFSNNLAYQGEPLVPLRQYGAGRLEPTVLTRHVSDGYLRGMGARQVNPPEADAIVEEIARIQENPAYEGKTIGVISLVGEAQAREIERLLIGRLGPEAMERRQIVCGDAYAFQGDERDVMFLSLVSAPQENRRIPAMTDDEAQRRFNVAASRARDQMYLFHTATLGDLNPRCVRYQLLEYCSNPRVAISDVSGLDVPQLEALAWQADRQFVSPPAPFDSWFELDVFLAIARRGYRVIPQFEVGGYRIDLVVQGLDGSLAVECDGDAWHGPDRYEADAARQRDLERCEWEFWRLPESVFRLDPDEALTDLWKTLERRQVFPTSEDKMRRNGAIRTELPVNDEADQQPIESETLWQKGDLSSSFRPQNDEELASPYPESTPPHLVPILLDADGHGRLARYVEWEPADLVPDPRIAEREHLVSLLAEVAASEGPVVAIRAYRLINRASGSQRLTAPARKALNQACAEAVRKGLLTATNPLNKEGQQQLVLRRPGSPEVFLRERGPRELEEFPPDEVAGMLVLIGVETGTTEPEALKRQLLETLNWVRLTRKVNEFLDQCMELI